MRAFLIIYSSDSDIEVEGRILKGFQLFAQTMRTKC